MGMPVLDQRGQQPPPPAGALSRPKYGFLQALQDIAIPVLSTIATGGFGLPFALAYGASTAAEKYRSGKDPLDNALYQAELAKAQASPYQSQADIAEAQFFTQNPELFAQSLRSKAMAGIPSAIQEWDHYSQLSPDQQSQYLNMKRAAPAAYGAPVQDYSTGQWMLPPKQAGGTPQFMGAIPDSPVGISRQAAAAGATGFAGGMGAVMGQNAPDAVQAKATGEATVEGAKTAKVDKVKNLNLLASMVDTQQQALASLDSAIAKVEAGPESNAVSDWTALLDPDLQVLRGIFNDQFLQTLSANAQNLKGSLSDKEGDALRSVGGYLTNRKSANLEILRNRRQSLLRSINAGRTAYQDISSSDIRPLPPEYGGKKTAKDYLNAN
jgi:hypothetical protein